jgi:hypothetical protein
MTQTKSFRLRHPSPAPRWKPSRRLPSPVRGSLHRSACARRYARRAALTSDLLGANFQRKSTKTGYYQWLIPDSASKEITPSDANDGKGGAEDHRARRKSSCPAILGEADEILFGLHHWRHRRCVSRELAVVPSTLNSWRFDATAKFAVASSNKSQGYSPSTESIRGSADCIGISGLFSFKPDFPAVSQFEITPPHVLRGLP